MHTPFCRPRCRDPSQSEFAGLVRAANRPGRIGREALAVLQDLLLERFGTEFERQAEQATSIASERFSERVLVFYPHQVTQAEKFGGLPSPIPGHVPPFDIATEEQLTHRPLAGIVVWSTRTGFKTAAQQARWRGVARNRRAAERARPSVVLEVERIRLDRQGYDRRGTYYGTGRPFFRVTSTGPLPPDVEPRPTGRFGYVASDGYWIDTFVRAETAREARREVAREFGVRPRTRAPRVANTSVRDFG